MVSTYTYKSFAWLDQRTIHAIHFMVQAASIAQIVASAIASPQRRRNSAAIDAFATLAKCKVHGTVVWRCALEWARIIGTPRAHHHVLCVKLCRQLRMRWCEIVRGTPAILCARKCGAVAVLAVRLQWPTRWHVHRRIGGGRRRSSQRCLVVIGTGGIANACCHLGVGGRWWMEHIWYLMIG